MGWPMNTVKVSPKKVSPKKLGVTVAPWTKLVERDDRGRILKHALNCTIAIGAIYKPEELRLNTLSDRIEFMGKPITDYDTAVIKQVLIRSGLCPSTDTVAESTLVVATERAYNPAQQWLSGLRWDGVRRLDKLLHTHWNTEDTPLMGEIGRCFVLSIAARIRWPGCLVHTVPIFQGTQGVGKSRALKALLPVAGWFGDAGIPMHDPKAAHEAMSGKLLMELSELDSFKSADWEQIKAFVSRGVDTYRAAYARFPKDHPRTTVLAGTTNHEEFLGDPTGSRRFWPVKVGQIRVDLIEQDRDQFFAEAAALLEAGEQWHLRPEFESALTEHHKDFRKSDAIEAKVFAWIKGRKHHFGVEDCARGIYPNLPEHAEERVLWRVGRAIRNLVQDNHDGAFTGWKFARPRKNNPDRLRRWIPAGVDSE